MNVPQGSPSDQFCISSEHRKAMGFDVKSPKD